MRVLTLAKGSLRWPSSWIRLAREVNKVLCNASPRERRRAQTASRPSAGAASMAARCKNDGGRPLPKPSAASASASIASIAAGLSAAASASRAETPCCTRRIVAAVVLPATVARSIDMADTSAESSSCRTLLRWSQVFALSAHIFANPFKYSWSSKSVAATVVRWSLFAAMSSCFCAFNFFVSSSSKLFCLITSFCFCISASYAATAFTSSASTSAFSARKSLSRPSRVLMMRSEWNL
mmetsp:Transcript_82876/g.231133  ORF Transcript_82876/g.231133 Transcript_82876/m.231133 type:complete len:238 (-) Transcript_82876:750-1463(-)